MNPPAPRGRHKRRLTQIAAALSTPQRRVSPMQVAAQLLEEAVGRVSVPSETPGRDSDPENPTVSDT